MAQAPEFSKEQAAQSSALVEGTVKLIDQVRPDLYRYCLSLTGSIFDAEDLVQETLARGLHRLSMRHSGVEAPRSYLFRIATNAWIDEIRRNRPSSLELAAEPKEASGDEPKSLEVGEAFTRIVQHLGPKERVIVVLREAFDFPIAEIAAYVGVSENHARVLLHRARRELAKVSPKPASKDRPSPPAALVDAFVAAFNKRDTKALVALLAEHGESDIIGIYGGIGGEVAEGIFSHTFPDPTLLEAEKRDYLGETIILLWYQHPEDKEKRVVRDIIRIEGTAKIDGVKESKTTLTQIRFYYFAKDVLLALAKELGVEAFDNDYHFPIG